MAMLPMEKALATQVYFAVGEWPQESKRNLVEAIEAALKEQRDTEREACAKVAKAYAELSSLDPAIVAAIQIHNCILARGT